MRLQKLQIKGFKSFADDTSINFNENVIGVVGPNGSGKSNIVDAIRWVLGEQKSRELRLEKMGDVLFSGTKKRKKAPVAQVSLTFDNTKNVIPTEFQTVTISRLLYRSGQSEYRVNNVPCRLKDVTNLFIDTGIGSNSYAIISLGMVDDILIDNDNSRRRMFEQAAGVSKYKIRKKETLNKLKITDADLDRIEDLLFEIEGNLKQLEKQAKRARKYYVLKNDYKLKCIEFANAKVSHLLKMKKASAGQIQAETKLLREAEVLLNKTEARLQKEKADNLDNEQSLSTYQKELNELIQKNRQAEYQKDLLREKIGFNKKRVEEYEQNISKYNDSHVKLDEELHGIQIKINKIKEELINIRNEHGEAAKEYEIISKEFEENRTASEMQAREQMELEQSILSKEKELAVLNARIVSLNEDNNRLKEKIGYIGNRIEEKEGIIREHSISLDQQRDLLQFQKLEKEKRNQARNDLRQQLEQEKENLSKVNRTYDAVKNEYELLKDLVESMDGYPESLKYLIQHTATPMPILADIIDVDPKYKGILEHYLSSYLNHFVVQSLDEAINAIQLLKNTQKGKANFFILENVEDVSTDRFAVDPTFIPVLPLVKYEAIYHSLMVQLLGNVFFTVDDISLVANEKFESPIVLLSGNGDFILKQNTLSGGSVGLFEGTRLGRKAYLEELRTKTRNLTNEKDKLEEIIQILHDKFNSLNAENLNLEIDGLINEIHSTEQKVTRLNAELNASNHSFSELSDKVENNSKLLIQYQAESNKVRDHLASNQKTYEIIKSSSSPFSDEKMNALSVSFSAISRKMNQLKISLVNTENSEYNLTKEWDFKSANQAEIANLKNTANENMFSTTSEIETFTAQLTDIEQLLISGYALQKSKTNGLGEIEQTYYKAKAAIIDLEESLREINRNINSQNKKIGEITDKHKYIRYQIQGTIERIKIEFGIDEFEPEEVEGISEEEIIKSEAEVQNLKTKLERFGEINPLALEAFDEMKERYDSITMQRDDVLQAKHSLMDTMYEIESTATAKFMEAFNTVRDHFKLVFRSLFTEDDDCDLVLIDHDSPLEANIEIIAKPKGKRPRTLSQLSGGEKTLTAIALLFSLYLLKPAPFCVFDEVDAPLDDANIQKFNKIIKNFSNASQFIIVTHNKITMAEVDILYGVYMQEQGVSGLTPVDLRKYQYEPAFETV